MYAYKHSKKILATCNQCFKFVRTYLMFSKTYTDKEFLHRFLLVRNNRLISLTKFSKNELWSYWSNI